MSDAALLTWTVVALLGVVTPGIDTVLVLRHTVLGSRRDGLLALLGIGLGCLAWATASLAGLTALLAASTMAYNIIRVVGAAYLIWLGASAIRKTLSRNTTQEADLPAAAGRGGLAALRAGVVTNLLNPKVGVFYISLLPQFMPAGSNAARWGVLLVAIHLAVTFLWYPMLIWFAAKVRATLVRQRVRQWMDRVTATVLIGLGIKLAAEAR
ncbi:LysE family translocator [Nocardia sp. NPDC058705]|uniref:LysE family translocator n=1 Tax=Nocardia sp. NPDC058705 TaxID=3346609 RepID=UPI0036B2F903